MGGIVRDEAPSGKPALDGRCETLVAAPGA
jgi:hypothetical protein